MAVDKETYFLTNELRRHHHRMIQQKRSFQSSSSSSLPTMSMTSSISKRIDRTPMIRWSPYSDFLLTLRLYTRNETTTGEIVIDNDLSNSSSDNASQSITCIDVSQEEDSSDGETVDDISYSRNSRTKPYQPSNRHGNRTVIHTVLDDEKLIVSQSRSHGDRRFCSKSEDRSKQDAVLNVKNNARPIVISEIDEVYDSDSDVLMVEKYDSDEMNNLSSSLVRRSLPPRLFLSKKLERHEPLTLKDDVILIDPTKSKSEDGTDMWKQYSSSRSKKDTLVGGANKVVDMTYSDGYYAGSSTQDPVGAGSHVPFDHHGDNIPLDSSHSVHSDEKPINDCPQYPVYAILKKKLQKECRQIDHIRGDGNCFFRAVSKQLYGNESYHPVLRNLIVDLIATNKSKFSQFVDGGDVQDHVERMSQEQSWATTCEIYAAATLFQRDVFMLTPDHLNETYSWLLFQPVFKLDPKLCSLEVHPCFITLCNTNGNHYDRIVGDHGDCNCFMAHPQLEGVSYEVDLSNTDT